VKRKVQEGTEVVSGGIRGVITSVITERGQRSAYITWETGSSSQCWVDAVRPARSPAVVRGIAPVRFARGADRLQHLLKD
jgi:hypothetical protein